MPRACVHQRVGGWPWMARREPTSLCTSGGKAGSPFQVIGRIVIDDVRPRTPMAHYPAKAVVGEAVTVSADVFRDGHDILAAQVRWRSAAGRRGDGKGVGGPGAHTRHDRRGAGSEAHPPRPRAGGGGARPAPATPRAHKG